MYLSFYEIVWCKKEVWHVGGGNKPLHRWKNERWALHMIVIIITKPFFIDIEEQQQQRKEIEKIERKKERNIKQMSYNVDWIAPRIQ